MRRISLNATTLWHSWLQRRLCCSKAGIILCIDYGVSAVEVIMESRWSLMCTTLTQKGGCCLFSKLCSCVLQTSPGEQASASLNRLN